MPPTPGGDSDLIHEFIKYTDAAVTAQHQYILKAPRW